MLDCGIKAIDEIAYAKEKGIDFIICDHHVPDDVLPPAVAILNPKMPGSSYPCPHLSGCGVGFKFMQAFALSNGLTNHNELESLLDLVAVSIAADIVPIIDENRIMAFHGLRRLNSNPNLGLRSIIRLCKLTNKDITISDVIFKIDHVSMHPEECKAVLRQSISLSVETFMMLMKKGRISTNTTATGKNSTKNHG